MRVVCVGYRKWALDIYDYLASTTNHQFFIIRSKEQYNENSIIDFKPDYVLFYGWSWMISKDIFNNFNSIMLHPSALPKYRGGSPIQNQILDGLKESKITLFKINEGVDTGDIYFQEEYSLEGTMDQIFERFTAIGIKLSLQLISNEINPIPQVESEATFCKRRKPSDSEITIEELTNKPGVYLYNKIRMLGDPYPNAFFSTSDGKRIYFKEVSFSENE